MLAAKTVRSNNTSGVPGVDWLVSKGRWRATICFKGKRHYLGSYSCFEDAVKARRQAEKEMHDRFVSEFTD
nr:AP2 domain-containing protein [Parablautia muri]